MRYRRTPRKCSRPPDTARSLELSVLEVKGARPTRAAHRRRRRAGRMQDVAGLPYSTGSCSTRQYTGIRSTSTEFDIAARQDASHRCQLPNRESLNVILLLTVGCEGELMRLTWREPIFPVIF